MTVPLVLSPHLDDAVLSAAGVLLDNPEGAVVTCFAGVPPPETAPSDWDRRTGVTDPHRHALARREEDVAALAALGAGRPVHLDLLEAAYRDEPAEQTRRALVEALRPHAERADLVFGPLGVGGHPDHLLVRTAAVALADDLGLPLRLYADQPYAREHGWPTRLLPRARRLARQARDLTRRPPDRERHWRPALQGLALEGPRLRDLTDSERGRKRTAVAAYASQVPALGGLDHAVGGYEVLYARVRDDGGGSTWPGR